MMTRDGATGGSVGEGGVGIKTLGGESDGRMGGTGRGVGEDDVDTTGSDEGDAMGRDKEHHSEMVDGVTRGREE